MKLNPPESVRKIAKTLESAGFETWCVGGAIRDALLGHPHLDWDLATAAKPQDVQKLFKRTLPVGIDFGTLGVLDADGVMHEVTTVRKDIERKIIRAVGDPRERMREDRLRALRAIRFGARFGFEIDPATWAAIVESAPEMSRLSAERVKQEIEKTMEQVKL